MKMMITVLVPPVASSRSRTRTLVTQAETIVTTVRLSSDESPSAPSSHLSASYNHIPLNLFGLPVIHGDSDTL